MRHPPVNPAAPPPMHAATKEGVEKLDRLQALVETLEAMTEQEREMALKYVFDIYKAPQMLRSALQSIADGGVPAADIAEDALRVWRKA